MKRHIWLAAAATVCASLIFVVPAKATAPAPAASAAGQGIAGNASAILLQKAPSTFRTQVQTYFKSALAVAQRYHSATGMASLTSQVAVAQKLMLSATAADLNAVYTGVNQMPAWTHGPTALATSDRYYQDAHHFLAARIKPSFKPHGFAPNCPAAGDTTAVRLALGGAYAIARLVYSLWASSLSIVAGGPLFAEGFTLPLSPIKIIVSVFLTVTFLAFSGAQDAYAIRNDCIEAAHRAEMDAFKNYIGSHVANIQVQVAVTPIDTYHFLISTHENGQPININPSTVQLETFQGAAGPNGQNPLALILNGQSLCGTPPTQYVCVAGASVSGPIPGTDPGVYELTIPTTLAGTSYRLIVDDGAGNPNTHYGAATFTPLQHS